MKKIKIGVSVLILFVICFALKKIDLLFSYILALFLHEMAHLFVATRCGYNLKLFRFDLFGMSVELDAEIENKDSFAINIAGPVFNLLLAIVCCATYWLVPQSYLYLNAFCFSNIALAVFNLLPIYPLDGGKIFRTIFKSDKAYKIADRTIRFSLTGVFFVLFLFSIKAETNWFFLMMSVFFVTSRPQNRPTFSIFKSKSQKHMDKVVVFKVSPENTLFDLVKMIKKSHFTIFYYSYLSDAEIFGKQNTGETSPNKKEYLSDSETLADENTLHKDGYYIKKLDKIRSRHIFIDEDELIDLSLNHPLTAKLKEIF